MHKTTYILRIFVCVVGLLNLTATATAKENGSGWKAGTATITITPDESIWMAGYASREHPSEGILHDLKAKAIAFEDAGGKQSVLITTDLLGFPKSMSDDIRSDLKEKYGLSKSQIILSSTHTHSGPVLAGGLVDIYPMEEADWEKAKKYSEKLHSQLVDLVGKALKSKKPVKLFCGNGVSRFQVNRRNNNEKTLWKQTELRGPNDYTVSVLKVVNNKDKMVALIFGYGCHPTVLDGYDWCGDYPGYAQLELEKLYRGTTAMFFQSCGADQNPMPRREVPMALQYGKELAASVECALAGDMKELDPNLNFEYAEIEIPLINIPTLEDLERAEEQSEGYEKRWATRLISEIKSGKELQKSYPYPVQIWKMGELPVVVLGGEIVSEYSLKLRQIFGQQTFVIGYANDVMGYIPTSEILLEGGYETVSSQKAYGLPGIWAPDIETQIFHATIQMAKELNIQPEVLTKLVTQEAQNK